MKKIFLLLLLITGFAQAQIINFPDGNFKAKLLEADTSNMIAYSGGGYIKIDGNNDGEIQVFEAQVVERLYVDFSGIADLTGISNFINLTVLGCSGNAITVLDVTNLNNLTTLDCENNLLTSLDVTSLTNLINLYCNDNLLNSLNVVGLNSLMVLHCSRNQLTVLNISGLGNLNYLECDSNQFASIDLTGSTNLGFLLCGNNQITSLDLSNLINLESLQCNGNLLTSLDISNNTLLYSLSCNGNLLTSLDISNNTLLYELDCHDNQITSLSFNGLLNLSFVDCSNNQLTSLDFSGNPLFTDLNCENNDLYSLIIKNGAVQNSVEKWGGNPNLFFVCIDDNEITGVQDTITQCFLTNANVNSYCSFAPGGDYNTITGITKFDQDNNGCADDAFEPNIKMIINGAAADGASFTSIAGNYTFYTDAGSFVVFPDIENAAWFSFSPPNLSVSFADNDNNIVNQDFCIAPIGNHHDVEIVIAPIRRAVPGFDAEYQIVYKNKGNQILTGDVNFTYNDGVLDFMSATVSPDSQSTGSLTWNYSNLRPFENRTIYVTLNVNSPTETPPVNSGDVLDFTVTVNPITGDELPADNVFDFHQTVVNSYDPNDKTCIEGGIVSPTQIGGYLHYVINFENIGTAEAENIVVKDVIDETMFDVKSLQVLNSSAPVEAKITGNVAEFIFKGIRLRGGGHGNILLKIKTRSDLQVGDVVSNKADIFFDYNFPIETNVANTTFQTLNANDYIIDASVSIYPNPSKANVSVKANGMIKSVQLFDIQGRILETKMINEKELSMDISKYSNGVYFLKVITDIGMKTEKLIKD